MTKYAYVRVSAKEQNIDRQLMALELYGIREKTSSVITSPAKILKDHSINS